MIGVRKYLKMEKMPKKINKRKSTAFPLSIIIGGGEGGGVI